ncbi:NAD(P)H-dependent FMN reductase [Halolactibacillus halophilus]|uniref:FMN reductase n=1 Tax=Halolactibacillus halophilus TaxID=306540 RepID=A0A1I5RI02_9BACI|nr:NAD(P)H-dependent oxidoreductase [Halolactibacillus halophilus]GEM02344.1 FMN reductase [Halolactibacillus halophilus]SFP57576.1 NAD(P)H-dependent FMN reductase [Halolactibacillus halophilus]
MKFVGIVGSNADLSYNRKLLQFIKTQYQDLFELDVVEIKDIPMFNQSDDQTNSSPIQNLNQKILAADGVIIATPEHNHTIPAGLKSVLEWLSFKIHPLENKPVMIVGASYYDQGSSRAQLHLRQILDAPGVNAIVMPGNEFLLGKVKESFNENDQLIDTNTVKFLQGVLEKFVEFVRLVNRLEAPKEEPLPKEDLHVTGTIDTTIKEIDMAAEDWVEQAAAKVNAVEGNTYVKLNRGILTVDQINTFLASMPMELTYADDNNQFLYYNYTKEAEDMLADRVPGQAGNPLALCHPERSLSSVEWVIQQLRSGRQDVVRVHVPTHGPDKFVVHNYQAMHDEEGNYKGINEFILDFKPIVDWYLKQTGLTLEGDIDAGSGASQQDHGVDAGSGASEKA